MKQKITIEIDVKEGYELKFNPETKTIEEVPIRSRTWEEFCHKHNRFDSEWIINKSGRTECVSSEVRHGYYDANLKTREDAIGIIALIQLTRLHDEWVGDWKITNNGKMHYTYIHSWDDSIRISEANNHWSKLLIFPTKEMAGEFLECFEDLIEKAKKFI